MQALQTERAARGHATRKIWLGKGMAIAAALLLAACQDPSTGLETADAPQLDAEGQRGPSATVAWNEVARGLVVKHGTGAAPAIRVFALVSVAQYNAAVEAEREGRGRGGPSVPAAVAGASAAVLTYLYPAEAAVLEGIVDAQEQSAEGLGDFASGEQIGRAIGAGVVQRAQGDKYFEPFTGTVPVCDGCWLPVPTPPAFATLGQAKTFFLSSGAQFRPAPPPAFGSADFTTALNEVKTISVTRTAAQDSIAKFWALAPGTVSPLGYWNVEAAKLIVRRNLDERRAAHVLALMNMAGYDAVVASHEAKYFYWLIRPSQADPSIALAIGMPSFPAYPSNHATISAAAAFVLGAQFPSDRARLAAEAEEAAISRIYGGIHYRFDADAGLELGRRIGRLALEHDVKGHRPFPL